MLYVNINLKWTIEQNIRAKAIKLLEENIREYLCNIGLGKQPLDVIHKRKKLINWIS